MGRQLANDPVRELKVAAFWEQETEGGHCWDCCAFGRKLVELSDSLHYIHE